MKKEVLYEVITALESLNNPNEALKLVAKVLTNTALSRCAVATSPTSLKGVRFFG